MKKVLYGLWRIMSLKNKYLSLGIVAVLFNVCVFAQVVDTTKIFQNIEANGYNWKGGKFRTYLVIPSDTPKLKLADSGAISYKGAGQWFWNGRIWKKVDVKVNQGIDSTYFTINNDTIRFISNLGTAINWNLSGNAGTDSAINFIGTTDLKPLVIKINGQQLGKFNSRGSIALGTNNNAPGDSAIAMGYGAYASGKYATANGQGAVSSGFLSTAIGWNSRASGSWSMASGNNSTASGIYSTASVYGATASGDYSTANGYGSAATGIYSTANGYGAIADGSNSTAGGNSSRARGNNSTASGFSSEANGLTSVSNGSYSIANGAASVASGYSSRASGDASVASGYYTKSKSYQSFTVGAFNDTTDIASPTVYNPLGRLFSIGNGTADNVRSNAMTILQNGNVGIGTLTPSAKLEVSGDVISTQFKLSALNTAPATATSAGTTGEIRIVNGFIYVCVALNVWQRASLLTF